MLISNLIYPGLGFFGASPTLSLRAPIYGLISGLRISLESVEPTYLNIEKVSLLKNGNIIPENEFPIYVETISTQYSEVISSPTLLKGGGIHTACESSPAWQVIFQQGIFLDEILVENRRDTWSRRARPLCVDVMDAHGQWRRVHENIGDIAILRTTASLARSGVLDIDSSISPLDIRKKSITRVVDILSKMSSEQLCLQDWRVWLALIDIWDSAPLDEDELSLVAAFVYAQLLLGDDFSFSYLSSRLYSDVQVNRLLSCINKNYAEKNSNQFMFTRHGLQEQGRLLTQKDEFIKLAENVIHVLEKHGYQPTLAYGTLLGAVRDQGFIAHDDDFDLLCRVPAYDFNSAREIMNAIKEIFERCGYSTCFSTSNALNIHVHASDSGALIDVFPYWVDSNGANLHMEKMLIRSIPENYIFPRSSIDLYGRSFPVPVNFERFLSERYGSDWMVPSRYFEWPWELRSE